MATQDTTTIDGCEEKEQDTTAVAGREEKICVTRRNFLLTGAGGTAGAGRLLTVPGIQWPAWAKTVGYPR